MPSNKLLQAAAGSAGGDNLYPEDVFSNHIYMGNDGTNQIVNGIDFSGEGGLVWQKARSTYAANHLLTDTVRGRTKILSSNLLNSEVTANDTHIASFNSDGFTLGSGYTAYENFSGIVDGIMSWSFRKAEGFFDIVTFTGNGSARTIAHNLGSVPKMIIVKSLSDSYNWYVYHASLTNQQNLTLDTSNPAGNSGAEYWNSTTATSSVFSLGTYFGVNGNNKTYVAYLFGDDAVFGEGGDEQICTMGTYTGTGSNGNTITLGFEPQWLMWKPSSGTGDWQIVDSMRGWTADGVVNRLEPNTSDTEATSGSPYCNLTSTGFVQNGSSGTNNASGIAYIYMAIRRPMKVPEVGTAVFAMDTLGSTGDGKQPGYRSPFPVDMGLKTTLTGNQRQISTRLLQGTELLTESTAAEAASSAKQFDYMNGTDTSTATSTVNMMWMFKRASKFMDVVAYTGNSVVGRQIVHNLKAIPEMMIFKRRNISSQWTVYVSSLGASSGLWLQGNNATISMGDEFNGTAPSASVFTVGNHSTVNNNNNTYVAYLFATLAGVSKVGTYTGNATNTTIDCGFSNGARFILIKRTDASGDWFVYDSTRGITSGISPYLVLNTTAAEVTNAGWLENASSGFLVNDNGTTQLNINNATYIFLAIA